ncbi:hypothetical protein ACJMK2_025027, partial [Sinanodonta woodiana]
AIDVNGLTRDVYRTTNAAVPRVNRDTPVRTQDAQKVGLVDHAFLATIVTTD